MPFEEMSLKEDPAAARETAAWTPSRPRQRVYQCFLGITDSPAAFIVQAVPVPFSLRGCCRSVQDRPTRATRGSLSRRRSFHSQMLP